MVVCFGLCVVAMISLGIWTSRKAVAAEAQSLERDTNLAAAYVQGYIQRFLSLAASLSTSAQFRSPQDHGLDSYRFSKADRRQARSITATEGGQLNSWLKSASGP